MIAEELKHITSTKSDLRKFGITVGTVFGLLGVLFLLRGKGAYPYFIIISAALILPGIVIPSILKPIYKVWMSFAVVMGWFMTRVILTILFFLIFTPISLISRLFGAKYLDVKIDKSAESYWNRRKSTEFRKQNYERQF